jgi:hypothetical protein
VLVTLLRTALPSRSTPGPPPPSSPPDPEDPEDAHSPDGAVIFSAFCGSSQLRLKGLRWDRMGRDGGYRSAAIAAPLGGAHGQHESGFRCYCHRRRVLGHVHAKGAARPARTQGAGCTKPEKPSAAPGTGTAIPEPGAIPRPTCIVLPGTKGCCRNGNGRNAIRSSQKSCAIHHIQSR